MKQRKVQDNFDRIIFRLSKIKNLYINGAFPSCSFNLYGRWNTFVYSVFISLVRNIEACRFIKQLAELNNQTLFYFFFLTYK